MLLTFCAVLARVASTQVIPLDTINWEIQAQSYVMESFKGKDAIYLQGGSIRLKDVSFLNGTIEYDVYLKQEQAFPGVYFRAKENKDAEQFYIRPHLPGKADANQAGASIKGVTPWQLYFGERYSFPYEYRYDDWTHVKILVKDDQAQVFLNGSVQPNLSWNTFTSVEPGGIILTGGNRSGMHVADVKVSTETPDLKDFNPIERKPIEGLIERWSISDKFSEDLLDETNGLAGLISERKWVGNVQVEEGTAANISRVHDLYDGTETNTVFAKVTIDSNRDQMKLLEFGYSDRVVVLLNGAPIYRGTNRWRSRDYRYLGTVGLFDAVYLNLKKGENELVMAVSEDFGGWLITGKLENKNGIKRIQ